MKFNMKLISLLFVLSIALASCGGGVSETGTSASNAPASGSLDASFGSGGIVTTAFGRTNSSYAHAVAIQDDGKIVAAGYVYNSTTYNVDFALVRYNTDGRPDTSFGTNGIVTTQIGNSSSYAHAVAIQKDANNIPKIVAVGYGYVNGSTAGSTINVFALARYDLNGIPDATFGVGGVGTVTTQIGSNGSYANAVAIQNNGTNNPRIVAAGYASNGTNNVFALVRYNTNGSLDTTFGTSGVVTTAIGISSSYAYAVTIQNDANNNAKIVAAGYGFINGSTAGSTINIFALARYNSINGSLDTSFGSGGVVTTRIGSASYANAVAIQNNGTNTSKILAAGSAYDSGPYDFAIARYNYDGSLDTSLSTKGTLTTSFARNDSSQIQAVLIQSDNKIVAVGQTNHCDYYTPFPSCVTKFALARYNDNGVLDTSLSTSGTGTVTTLIGSTSSAYAMAIQNDGKIVAAGYAAGSGYNDFALARYWP